MKFQLAHVAAAVSLAAASASLLAAGYPDKTVNYIIPFGPGGESDISARLQEPGFKKLTGQSWRSSTNPAPAAPRPGRN